MNAIILSGTMRRIAGLVLVVLLLCACDVSLVETPVLEKPVAPETEANTPTETEIQNQEHSYQLTLAPSWKILYWAERDDTTLLSDTGVEEAQSLVDADEAASAIDLVAQMGGGVQDGATGGEISLTISVVPRDGLSIQDYLTAAGQELVAIEDVMNISTGDIDGLRNDNLPLGVLRFERDGKIHQQLSLFNQDATEIILLSFTASVDQHEAMDRAIKQLMITFSIQG